MMPGVVTVEALLEEVVGVVDVDVDVEEEDEVRLIVPTKGVGLNVVPGVAGGAFLSDSGALNRGPGEGGQFEPSLFLLVSEFLSFVDVLPEARAEPVVLCCSVWLESITMTSCFFGALSPVLDPSSTLTSLALS